MISVGERRCERVRPQVEDPWGSGEGLCIVFPEVRWGGNGEEEVGLEVLVGLKEVEIRREFGGEVGTVGRLEGVKCDGVELKIEGGGD